MCERKRILATLLASALLIVALAAPAIAVDGVIEINQARALAGNVTPGDTAGFPVTISQPGSYRLTGNLTVSAVDVHAIQIIAEDVTIDLNGFAIIGPTVCSGSPLSCTPANSSTGVSGGSWNNISVFNGTVRGMGYGVSVRGRVEKVHATSNYSAGIATVGSIVSNNTVSFNGGMGIYGSSSTIIINNVVRQNLGDGIYASGLVIGNEVAWNGGYGLISAFVGAASYANNRFYNNNGGNAQVNGGGIQAGINLCNYSVCP